MHFCLPLPQGLLTPVLQTICHNWIPPSQNQRGMRLEGLLVVIWSEVLLTCGHPAQPSGLPRPTSSPVQHLLASLICDTLLQIITSLLLSVNKVDHFWLKLGKRFLCMVIRFQHCLSNIFHLPIMHLMTSHSHY